MNSRIRFFPDVGVNITRMEFKVTSLYFANLCLQGVNITRMEFKDDADEKGDIQCIPCKYNQNGI